MPAHLDLTVPDKNDIFDSAQEMLSEIEALRAIAGVTEEEKKEDKGNPESEVKPSDTQTHKVPKERVSKPSVKKVRKAESRKSSVEEDSDGNYRFWLFLPKEYALKCRLIQQFSEVQFKDDIKAMVLDYIDEIWEKNEGSIKSNITKVFK